METCFPICTITTSGRAALVMVLKSLFGSSRLSPEHPAWPALYSAHPCVGFFWTVNTQVSLCCNTCRFACFGCQHPQFHDVKLFFRTWQVERGSLPVRPLYLQKSLPEYLLYFALPLINCLVLILLFVVEVAQEYHYRFLYMILVHYRSLLQPVLVFLRDSLL